MNAPSFPAAAWRHAALVFAIALFVILTAIAIAHAAFDEGIVYSLDDVYIHMALAKNLVRHGVWGVTPWEFTNASSSPLWVGLIAAGFLVFGLATNLPLILAGLCSILVLVIAQRALSSATPQTGRLQGVTLLAALVALVLFTSLPALTMQGMEHPLHAALFLLGALLLGRIVAAPRQDSDRLVPGYLLLIAVLPLLRYESLWLAALGAALLAVRRRYALAALTVIAAVLPIALFGLWQSQHGNAFLPASIMAKSIGQAMLADDGPVRLVARFTWHPLQRLWSVPLLLGLWLAAGVILVLRGWQLRFALLDRSWLVLLGCFVFGTWIHATFATFGWGARYEAYLIALGIVALSGWLMQSQERSAMQALFPLRRRMGLYAVCGVLLVGLLGTGAMRLATATRGIATHEVLYRDLFIAHFLADAYPRGGVVAMNIGAITWIGEPHLTDVLTLGTPDVLRLFMHAEITPASIDRLARQRGAKIAVVFDEWFTFWTGGPAPWIPVAEIRPASGRQLVYKLYALNAEEARLLAERLKAYKSDPRFAVVRTLLPPYQ